MRVDDDSAREPDAQGGRAGLSPSTVARRWLALGACLITLATAGAAVGGAWVWLIFVVLLLAAFAGLVRAGGRQ